MILVLDFGRDQSEGNHDMNCQAGFTGLWYGYVVIVLKTIHSLAYSVTFDLCGHFLLCYLLSLQVMWYSGRYISNPWNKLFSVQWRMKMRWLPGQHLSLMSLILSYHSPLCLCHSSQLKKYSSIASKPHRWNKNFLFYFHEFLE